MIDVTVQNFEAEVIAASSQTPVLVDFWAPWCGPCRSLGPILEKLEVDYAGRFKLVKINTDEEQQLASAFGIRSLPTCILLKDGQPVDGFMGAVPEGQVRQFLDKHVPSADALAAEAEAGEAGELLASGDTDAARAKLEAALEQDPGNDDARSDYVRLLIEGDALDEAAQALAEPLAREPLPLRFEALGRWLDAARAAHGGEARSMDQLDAAIAADRRDFDARYARARLLFGSHRWTDAMDELLEIIMRDKKWSDEIARKTYVAILELMTPAPSRTAAAAQSSSGIELTGKAAMAEDPEAELLSSYRRKLSMALN